MTADIRGPGHRATLADGLRRAVAQHGDRPAVQFGQQRLTYAELGRRIERRAAALRATGVRPGDRVAVVSRNRIEALITHLAPLMFGAITVPINTRLAHTEIAHILADSDPAMVVVEEELSTLTERALHGLSAKPVVQPIEDDGPGDISADGPHHDGPLESDPAYLLYTSGTTGHPKGAVLTHLNLVTTAANSMIMRRIDSPELVWLAGLPLFHIGGLLGPLTHLLVGARSIITATGGFDAEDTVALMERERVTSCFFVPSQWEQICRVPDLAARTAALRQVVWGAAAATDDLLTTMREKLPHVGIFSSFGQTETSSATCMLVGGDSERKRGSVGRPVPHTEARIVDEQMRDVPEGAPGEIVYRGPTVMAGYWRNPEATAAAFRGGWFHSGDVCRRDEDGYVWMLSRLDDMINSGGENIYPAEVEEALVAHPSVIEAGVVGVADDRWGQTPVGFVVPGCPGTRLGPEELGSWCRERLAPYKVPSRIVVVASLPHNASGKLVRRRLPELLPAAASGSAQR